VAKDNTKLINQILQLKQEKARLLGKANYAELSLASKMATFDQAMSLLSQLRDSSHAAAVSELAQLRAFAAEKLSFKEEMMPWDVSFYAERLREAEFDFNEEELRPCVAASGRLCEHGGTNGQRRYFSLPRVLEGLFKLANKVPLSAPLAASLLTAHVQLFGVDVVPATGIDAPKWHEDVQVRPPRALPLPRHDTRAVLADQPRRRPRRLLLPRPLQPPAREAAGASPCSRIPPRLHER
jgi:oligopeptidase A